MVISTSRKLRSTSSGNSRINRLVALTALIAALLTALGVAQETPDATFLLNGRQTVDVTSLAIGNFASLRVQCAGASSFEDAVVTRVHGGMRIVARAGRICGLATSRAAVIEDLPETSQRESRFLFRTAQYRRFVTFQTGDGTSAVYKITGRSPLGDKVSELRIDATVTGGALTTASIALYRRNAVITHLAFSREQGMPISIEMLYPFIAAVMEQQYRRYGL